MLDALFAALTNRDILRDALFGCKTPLDAAFARALTATFTASEVAGEPGSFSIEFLAAATVDRALDRAGLLRSRLRSLTR